MLIKGKVILITGGAAGIGLSCAEEFLKNGCLGVTIVDFNAEKGLLARDTLNAKYGAGKVIFVKANVSDRDELEEAFKATVKTFKQLDVVFNNAGIFDEHNYRRSIDANVTGVVHGLKLAVDVYLPKYKSTDEAVIINTSSIGALISVPGGEIYSATKTLVVNLTQSFGNDFHLKRSGVRVLAICPGGTETALFRGIPGAIFYRDAVPTIEGELDKGSQKPEQLAKAVLRILESAENGSVWVIQEGREVKVEIPQVDLKNLL